MDKGLGLAMEIISICIICIIISLMGTRYIVQGIGSISNGINIDFIVGGRVYIHSIIVMLTMIQGMSISHCSTSGLTR